MKTSSICPSLARRLFPATVQAETAVSFKAVNYSKATHPSCKESFRSVQLLGEPAAVSFLCAGPPQGSGLGCLLRSYGISESERWRFARQKFRSRTDPTKRGYGTRNTGILQSPKNMQAGIHQSCFDAAAKSTSVR